MACACNGNGSDICDCNRIGREPVTVVELKCSRCSLVYGDAPCTAEVGTTGEQKCFNTRATCQDPENYAPEDKFVRFGNPGRPWPLNVVADDEETITKWSPDAANVTAPTAVLPSVQTYLLARSFLGLGRLLVC